MAPRARASASLGGAAARPQRPRVLYFSRIDFPSPKANSIQSFHTCLALARQGADVLFVVARLNGSRRDCFAYYGEPEHPRLRFTSLSLPVASEFNAWRGAAFRLYLGAFLRRHRAASTWVMSRDPAGLDLFDSLAAVRSGTGVRTLFEVHKLAFLTKASHQRQRGRDIADPQIAAKIERRRTLEARIYATVDGIVCTSASAQRMLGEHFAAHAPACVVPNGTRVDVDAEGTPLVSSVLDDRARDLDLVYVGQLYKWKGTDGLVAAMAHLPDAHLTIVGGQDAGDLERLRAQAASLGVAPRIDFVGQVAPHRVADYLARARVGVIPLPARDHIEAEHFTSPLKAFELMRSGVPIVASNLPSTREILTHDETAWLVAPDDPAALAGGLQRLRSDRVLAARLVAAAATRVLDYTWNARARRVLAFTAALDAVPAGA
jgi:glycosyltransferase involved in cell wall biosynthesis